MLKILVKKQLSEIFKSYVYDSKKNKARSTKSIIGLFVLFFLLIFGVLGSMFTFLSIALCSALAQTGLGWLYFALMGLMAIFLGAFGSVFNTYTTLYLSKDNDLMLSLPIPVKTLILSRLLSVYLIGLMYLAPVFIPAMLVYWLYSIFTKSATFGMFIGSIIMLVLISIFVLTLCCALGWVVAKVSVKLKHKSFVTVIISLLFIVIYYFVYFKAQSWIQNLIANAEKYGEAIKQHAYPIYMFGSVSLGDILSVLVVSAIIISLFVLVSYLISKTFLKIATSSSPTVSKAYKEKKTKQKGSSSALLRKEFNRLFTNANYMLNCALSSILLPVAGIALLIRGGDIISFLNSSFGEIAPNAAFMIFVVAIIGIGSMNISAAPSISLEGKSLWILQSLPVTPWQVLRSKFSVQIIITGIPSAFCLFCIAMVQPVNIPDFLIAALVIFTYIFFNALFCMFLGIKAPNFNWTNETQPIKQSLPTLISVLTGLLFVIVFVIGYIFLSNTLLGYTWYMLITWAVLSVFSVILFFWLKKKGTARFTAL